MITPDDKPDAVQRDADWFPVTRWSMVLNAKQSDLPQARAALEDLCKIYWRPLYIYVRSRVSNIDDAHDLTQAFFEHLIDERWLDSAARDQGRFRSYLLIRLKHFMSNEWKRARAAKRGGGQFHLSFDELDAENPNDLTLVDGRTPDEDYEKRWAMTLLNQVLTRLQDEQAAAGKSSLFETLKFVLTGDGSPETYAEIANRLATTESNVKVSVHRLRLRYRELLRLEIAQTVSSPKDIDDEIRGLMAALSK